MTFPNHVAFIMDGNGRWGLKKYNNRLKGHEYGIKNVKSIIDFFLLKRIKYLSLYTLSFDNLKKRNKIEINNLFSLLEKYLDQNIKFFLKKKIKLNFIGEKQNLPKRIKFILLKYQKLTDFKKKYNLLINIAINYSSKKEIISTFKKLKRKKLAFNEKNFNKNHYSNESNNPCILIRTGSHQRLSDFFLWQLSYSELFFVKKLWPDFKVIELKKIFKKFNQIKRNFGK